MFREVHGSFHYAESLLAQTSEEIEAFLHKALGSGCIEGLVIKKWDEGSHYQLAKRSYDWLKVFIRFVFAPPPTPHPNTSSNTYTYSR